MENAESRIMSPKRRRSFLSYNEEASKVDSLIDRVYESILSVPDFKLAKPASNWLKNTCAQ